MSPTIESLYKADLSDATRYVNLRGGSQMIDRTTILKN